MKNKVFSLKKWVVFSVLCLTFQAWSLEIPSYFIEGREILLDLPIGFQEAERSESRISFMYKDASAFVQVKHYPQGVDSLPSLAQEVMSKMGGTGEGVEYEYGSHPAWFGSFGFSHLETAYQSYACLLKTGNSAVVILAFAPVDQFANYNDLLVSSIDSFSYPEDQQTFYGPIGAFDRFFLDPAPAIIPIHLHDMDISAKIPVGYTEAEDFVIQREARILNTDGTVKGWKRFYRMIAKDVYTDIAPLSQAIRNSPLAGLDEGQFVSALLSYVQEFTYERSKTLADIHPGMQALLHSSGDCDTRSLLLLGLLNYFDIEGILLVSTVYMHGMAGVAVPYEGAGYLHNGVKYIIAETTERVDLGLIAADMADPANWIPVELWE
ncbi:MAG: hypothetical protein JXB03_08635 [Spirochaetales bacterium]|nr:hypothetical protein [Spirochaetales bacterium]